MYQRCRRLLAEELGAYPSPETESIYRELLQAPSLERRAAPRGVAPALPMLVLFMAFAKRIVKGSNTSSSRMP